MLHIIITCVRLRVRSDNVTTRPIPRCDGAHEQTCARFLVFANSYPAHNHNSQKLKIAHSTIHTHTNTHTQHVYNLMVRGDPK